MGTTHNMLTLLIVFRISKLTLSKPKLTNNKPVLCMTSVTIEKAFHKMPLEEIQFRKYLKTAYL